MGLKIFEKKMSCPKCKSSNVLVGNDVEPHHCSDCHHKWNAIKEHVIGLKCMPKLFTINKVPCKYSSRQAEPLDKKLDDIMVQLLQP